VLGQTMGRYRILAPLGEGGMGVVYLAEDLTLQRRVALKFLPSDAIMDPEACARLVHEARAAAALLHPNICPVYEIAEADGRTFIAMAHLEGRTLRQRLELGPVPVDQALSVARQIGEALVAAHARGVVHRDVKPGNVMLLPDGRAVLLDFGLARVSGATRLTRSGTTLGTTAYLAPEQVAGAAADERSDVWALGVVLYELVAGRPPFAGESAAAQMYAIVNAEPEHLDRLRPGVPAGLGGIVTRALAKDPAKRYPSAAEMVADLAAIERDRVAVPAGKVHRTLRSRAWLPAALPLGVVALIVVLTALDAGGLRTRLLGGGSRISSIAVLPLVNLSNDPEQEYFADGMTEELIDELAKIGSLRVISRTSTAAYKGAKKPLPQIARELNVDAIVEGAVARSGSQLRITAELIQARPERHLWGNHYVRQLDDVLALQSELARAIAEQVRAQVTPEERARLSRARAVNPAAHEAYLRGQYVMPTYDQAKCRAALKEYERSVALDPTYAPGWAGIAAAYYMLSNLWMPPEEAMPKAREAARRAIELDDQIPDGHAALGIVLAQYDRDWAAAETELKKAIGLNPSYQTAHMYYGFLLSERRRFGEAVREFELAAKLDPLSRIPPEWAAWTLYLAGDYDRAIARYRTLEASDSTDVVPHYSMAICYLAKRMPQQALREVLYAGTDSTNNNVLAARCGAHALLGQRREALTQLELLLHPPPGKHSQNYPIALACACLGDRDRAFRWLEKCFTERDEDVNWLAADPLMRQLLGDDPRYAAMLRRLGPR